MCAIEENREPLNSARENLKSLALTFAAVYARRQQCEIEVGSVRALSDI
jgi:regulator of PEP synthase PpsR (kinase-PPPase family)